MGRYLYCVYHTVFLRASDQRVTFLFSPILIILGPLGLYRLCECFHGYLFLQYLGYTMWGCKYFIWYWALLYLLNNIHSPSLWHSSFSESYL